MAVRPKQDPVLYTAYEIFERTAFTLPLQHNRTIIGQRGDWVIQQKDTVIEVLPADVFRHMYAPADLDTLTITNDQRAAIERTLGIGATAHGQALVQAIERMARLVIGNVQVDFTPGQWEELAHRAQKRGITVDKLVAQIVAKITADIWVT